MTGRRTARRLLRRVCDVIGVQVCKGIDDALPHYTTSITTVDVNFNFGSGRN